jgi:hypothetical protein
MDEIYGIRRFVPGQIWNLIIDTESLDDSHVKERPYLVIGANNRRLTLLKMTHGGTYASNWIYTINNGDGKEDTNIILDCPIVVNITKVIIVKNWATMTPALFKSIYTQHLAAMLSQSDPTFINDPEFIRGVSSLIENHEDKLLSYSLYTRQYIADADYDDAYEDNNEYADASAEEETTSEEPVPDPIVEEEVEESEPEETEKVISVKRVLGTKRTIPDIADIFEIGGRTDIETLYKACDRVGVRREYAKMILGQMVKEKKLAYINGIYGITLKSELKISKHKREFYSDSEKYTNTAMAKIWGTSASYVSAVLRKEVKSRQLAEKSFG